MSDMTAANWNRLLELLDKGWPGELTEGGADAYRVLLAGIDPDRVLAGLRRLLHDGARFRPSAAEILGEARRDPSAPTFDEALTLIFEKGGVLKARPVRPAGLWTPKDREAALEAARRERAMSMHPLVASFVQRIGFSRLDRIDLENPFDRKELREAWSEHIDAQDGREVAVLASGRGAGELARLDPLARLGVTVPVGELTEGEAA